MNDIERMTVYQQKIGVYKEVCGLLTDFAFEFARMFYEGELEYIDDVSIYNDNVEVTYQFKSHCGSCFADNEVSTSFPVEYLWNANWKEIERTKREEIKQRYLQLIEEKNKTEQQKREERQYKLYLKLKGKFGNYENEGINSSITKC